MIFRRVTFYHRGLRLFDSVSSVTRTEIGLPTARHRITSIFYTQMTCRFLRDRRAMFGQLEPTKFGWNVWPKRDAPRTDTSIKNIFVN